MSKMFRLLPSGKIREVEVVPLLSTFSRNPVPGKFKLPGRYSILKEGVSLFTTRSGATAELQAKIQRLEDRVKKDTIRLSAMKGLYHKEILG